MPITSDSRIKTYVYNENDVFKLHTHYGYQLNIEFGPKESVQTVSVGDRTGWQIIPAGTRLFLRAMEDTAHTNMTVVTSRHAYQFDLVATPVSPKGDADLVYVVRFFYPQDQPAVSQQAAPAYPLAAASSSVSASPYNTHYTFEGSKANVPATLFDDGSRTYFQFAGKPPVVMAASAGGKPAALQLSPASLAGNQYLTAPGVYSRLILRGAGGETTVYNEAMGGL